MKKEAVIFLAEGFEEVEALAVVDVLRRAGAVVRMVSVSGKKYVAGSIKFACRQMKCLEKRLMRRQMW